MPTTAGSAEHARDQGFDGSAGIAELDAASARHLLTPLSPWLGDGPDEAASFRGSLLDYPFPSLMHRLHGWRATGTLLLASGKKRKAVQLCNGRPVAVKSNLVGECLANYLVRRGQLAEDDFEESLTRFRRGDGRQGEILVGMDLLSEERVSQVVCEQAEEKLFEIFEWREGGFKFKSGARIRRGHDLSLTRSPTDVIVEGTRLRVSLARVDAFIHGNCSSYVVPGENSRHRFQETDLDTKEAELVRLVGGQRQLGDFRTAQAALRRLLYGLIATQIFDLRAAADVAELRDLSASEAPSPELAMEAMLELRSGTEYRLQSQQAEEPAVETPENKHETDADSEFAQGESSLRRRRYERALVHFGKALELDAEEGRYHAHYGWCLFLCHQDNEMMIEEAIEHVRRGAKLARDQEKTYLFLGRLYKVLGRMRPAEKMFAQAVEIQPDCVDAMRELRLIDMRRQKERGLLRRFFPFRGKAKA